MKINNNRILLDEINSIKSSISDEELFSSKQFIAYLKEALKVALQRKEIMREVRLVAFSKSDDDFCASTDGKSVYINTLSPLVRNLPDRNAKLLCIIGHLVHEVGHRLFTDFKIWNIYFGSFKTGKFYPKTPKHKNFRNLEEKLSKDSYSKYIEFLSHQIANIYEDEYIENRLHSIFSGEFIKGLHLARLQIKETGKSIPEMIDLVEKGELDFLAFILNSMLLVASDGEIEAEGYESNHLYLKLLEVLEEVKPYAENLAWESDASIRAENVNEILCILSEFIPELDQEESGEDGTGEDNSGEDEEAKAEEKINNLSSSLAKSSAEPKGHESAIDSSPSESEKESAEIIKNNLTDDSGEDEEAKRELSKIYKDLAQSSLEEKEQVKRNNEALEVFVTNGGDEDKWHYEVKRVSDISDENKEIYQDIFSEVSKYSATTKRLLNSCLKQRKEEGKSKGYMLGRFDTTSHIKQIYVGDGKSFSKNIEPDGKPDVVFGVLIDQSGSMYGKKIIEARKTAILIEDVLENLDIPFVMVGHTVDSDDCTLFVYHDFVNHDRMDKFRLSSIEAISGNRDGAAIAYMCEKLKKRSEKRKILIVITDGIPAEIGFNVGCNAVEDTRITVSKYTKDIQIFGAVIDGEIDTMRRIYGEKVLDLCDLSKLPIQLTALIKRMVLR